MALDPYATAGSLRENGAGTLKRSTTHSPVSEACSLVGLLAFSTVSRILGKTVSRQFLPPPPPPENVSKVEPSRDFHATCVQHDSVRTLMLLVLVTSGPAVPQHCESLFLHATFSVCVIGLTV